MQTQGFSRHYNFLMWTYIDNAPVSVAKERNTLLFGARARETTEDRNERRIRKEIRTVFSQVFGGTLSNSGDNVSDIHTSCPTFLSATCHEQFKMLKVWLHPILWKYITE
jgi:mediator of RNA polymerase II transcription subunit 12